jgi:hypothetical protein
MFIIFPFVIFEVCGTAGLFPVIGHKERPNLLQRVQEQIANLPIETQIVPSDGHIRRGIELEKE